MSTIRQTITDLTSYLVTYRDTTVTDSIVEDMVSYFNRQDDTEQIRSGIKKRYGFGVKVVQDPNNSSATNIETYARGKFTEEVNEGVIEAIAAGFGPRVVNALATLFTQPGKGFTLHSEDKKKEDLEEEEKLLHRYRKRGGLSAELVKCDKQSVQIGSSAMLVAWSNRELTYQMVNASELEAYFGETILEDGVVRATDQRDIEDASIVTILLSQDQETLQYNYLAIYGRSDVYPLGRWVNYRANQTDTTIPDPGAADAVDYMIDGQVANPLSYYAAQHPDKNLPDYPIFIIKGGTTEEKIVMPTYTSLYTDCKEMDVSASHLSATSQDAARGTIALKINPEGAGLPLPRTLNGAVALQVGQDLEFIDHNAQNSVYALQVLEGLMINVAAGYSVPDYMIRPDDTAISKESGVALMVKTDSLKKARQFRIELNEHTLHKLHTIETELIWMHSDKDQPLLDSLVETEMRWDPGEITIPESATDRTTRIVAAKEAGLLDEIGGIAEYHQVQDDEAIKIYEKMAERAAKFPPLIQPVEETATTTTPVGLNGRSSAIQ